LQNAGKRLLPSALFVAALDLKPLDWLKDRRASIRKVWPLAVLYLGLKRRPLSF